MFNELLDFDVEAAITRLSRIFGWMLICIAVVVPWSSATADQLGDLKQRAESGDVSAMVDLANDNNTGNGMAQNYPEALKWFRRAADLGDAGAMTSVGLMYATGKGVPVDRAEALVWFNRAAQAGQLVAKYWTKIFADTASGQTPTALQPIDAVGIILGSDGNPQKPLQWIVPKATGKPHVCDDSYLHGTAADVVTGLQFHITERGDVVYVSPHHSSGVKELDGAATACISSWKFLPTVSNGANVAVLALAAIPWRAVMASKPAPELLTWKIDHPTAVMARGKGKPHVCLDYYPKSAMQAGIQGRTTIAFTITSEGATKDVRITRSSGSDILDDAAVKCAKEWQYAPAMENGKPIEIPWAAEVDLSLH